MKQSRLMSLMESLANVAIGYGIAVLTQVVVFPLFGIHASLSQNLMIGLIFTIVSIARSYALRRMFEMLRVLPTKMPPGTGRHSNCGVLPIRLCGRLVRARRSFPR